MRWSAPLLTLARTWVFLLLAGILAPASRAAEPVLRPTDSICHNFAHLRFHSAHAEHRKDEGRKTATAFTDGITSTVHSTYKQYDGRWIVRGPKGREHIYEPNGQHLTTIDTRTNHAHLQLVYKGDRLHINEGELRRFHQLLNAITHP